MQWHFAKRIVNRCQAVDKQTSPLATLGTELTATRLLLVVSVLAPAQSHALFLQLAMCDCATLLFSRRGYRRGPDYALAGNNA